ncbi:MAG: hypothetical protein AB1414_02175 [bacterium]
MEIINSLDNLAKGYGYEVGMEVRSRWLCKKTNFITPKPNQPPNPFTKNF